MELKTYPKYMYHVDHSEPVRVDSKAEQTDMENKGWTAARLFKEYPKWVGGKLVQSRAEENRLRADERKPLIEVALDAIEQGPASKIEEFPEPPEFPGIDPVAVKEIQVEGQDTAKVVEAPKKSSGRSKKA